MSSLPGYRLEDFLQWNYSIVFDNPGSNMSRTIAEAIGNIPQRPRLTEDQFKQLVALFEPHREYVEDRLFDFDEENQSWRDYASNNFDSIPDELYEQGGSIIAAPAT